MSTDLDTIPADAPGSLKRVEGADGTTLDDRWRYAKAVAGGSDVVPKGLWSPVRNADGTVGPKAPDAGKILVVTEIARMLGFHPLAGIMGVHIIEGRPTISPAMMSAKVRNEGHRLRVGTKGTVEGGDLTAYARLTRSDDPEFEYVVEWSLADAQRAGLGELKRNGQAFVWHSTKDNWRKYPRAMLKARAIAEVCREGAEDALTGAAYIPDELGAQTDEDGAMVDAPTRKPERDWAHEIQSAENIDVLIALREPLRNSPDYTPGLWNMLMTRFGSFAAAAEQPAEGEPEPRHDSDTGEVDESNTVDAEVVHDDDPDVIEEDDEPITEWSGEPCPRCNGPHDPSVHDAEEAQS